jgi:hypothetical protein
MYTQYNASTVEDRIPLVTRYRLTIYESMLFLTVNADTIRNVFVSSIIANRRVLCTSTTSCFSRRLDGENTLLCDPDKSIMACNR